MKTDNFQKGGFLRATTLEGNDRPTTGSAMQALFSEYLRNVSPAVGYKEDKDLKSDTALQADMKLIAYYLPQFHRSPENDKFWGVNFTEWTNATKAIPRFLGHYQPRLPGDLGFYNLEDENTLRAQIDLARRGGLYGFCIHHYWFSGKCLLRSPLDSFLKDPSLDFQFCLNWANENWTRKWDGRNNEILLEQKYEPEDPVALAADLTPAIRDQRYIRVNGRPLLMIYRPSHIPDPEGYLGRLTDEIHNLTGDRVFLVAPDLESDGVGELAIIDATVGFAPHGINRNLRNLRQYCKVLDPQYLGQVISYDDLIASSLSTPQSVKFPSICPSWDNEARRPGKGYTVAGSTPSKYGRWLYLLGKEMMSRPSEERIIFLNAWNEWAEGAYLEPDRHYGFAYLCKTREVLDSLARGIGKDSHEVRGSSERQIFFRHQVYKEYIRRFRRRLLRLSGSAAS